MHCLDTLWGKVHCISETATISNIMDFAYSHGKYVTCLVAIFQLFNPPWCVLDIFSQYMIYGTEPSVFKTKIWLGKCRTQWCSSPLLSVKFNPIRYSTVSTRLMGCDHLASHFLLFFLQFNSDHSSLFLLQILSSSVKLFQLAVKHTTKFSEITIFKWIYVTTITISETSL